MRSMLSRALAYVGAERSAGGRPPATPLSQPTPGADLRPPASATAPPARLTAARWRKFLSYYRPHLPLLAADLGCAILVSATTLALPLAALVVRGGALRRLARSR